MESSGGNGDRPKAEDVISKLKDDGDFDDLRLKIVRKIKENEDLRSLIISEVKQSKTLNCEGAENLKPRQLSDAIHEEIGNKVMGHISDELWRIIRSNEGMRDEIRDSVRSIYNKLMKPLQEKPNGLLILNNSQSSFKNDKFPEHPVFIPQTQTLVESPTVLPGFISYPPLPTAENSSNEEHKEEGTCCSPGLPPGFVLPAKVDEEEDPDLPPGFG